MKLSPFNEPLPAHEKRLILGSPSQQLFPLKYPWMRDYYKLAKQNHWEPEDINMSHDVRDYKNLTDNERRMYDWCLSMLTTQDLLVLANLEEAIERHLTCPEASMYLARQSAEEAIHTDSYQYIIESLSLDEDSVYQRYLREQTLYAKVEYAYRYHRKLMELRIEDHTDSEGIGEFLRGIAFWAMGMEGGFFYIGFLWVYALRRRKLMPGTAEMFAYIQRDEAMHMNFWLDVMNQIIHEYPEAYTPSVQADIHDMLLDVAHLEENYAHDMCQGVLGITPEEYMSHFKHRLNISAQRVGLIPPFTGVAALPWVSDFELIPENNFFETRVREYRKGGLSWEEGDTYDMFESPMT